MMACAALKLLWLSCFLPMGRSFVPSSILALKKWTHQLTLQETADPSLTPMMDRMEAVAETSPPLAVEGVFRSMVEDKNFREVYWQRKPFLVESELKNIKGCYMMEDVKNAVDTDFLEAGRGSFTDGRSGWQMATVSAPKGSSFQEAKLQYDDVVAALQQKNGTVVINSAGGYIPRLAEVCLDAVNAVQLPLAINMYLTNPGQKTSAPPHTDKQDVFVLQTSGYKHWRVFNPPPPARLPQADPYARGKGTDVLSLNELENPLIEATLGPGQMLYVPAGFPHTTDTIVDIPEDGGPSVHLTIGFDTLIWDLNYYGLRKVALQRAGLKDKLLPTKLATDKYLRLQDSLPMGFLSEDIVAPHMGFGSAMRKALMEEMEQGLISRMREAEPTRWAELTDAEMESQLQLREECLPRILQHHFEMVDIFAAMYDDVANKRSPAKLDLSFFRSQPYFQKMESVMESLHTWSKQGTAKVPKNARGKKSGKKKKGSPAS